MQALTASRRTAGPVVVVLALIAGACGAPGVPATPTAGMPATPTASGAPPAITTSPIVSPSPTAAPAAPTPVQTLTPTSTATDPEPPPIADLDLNDGRSVAGYQGSWCYDGACADSPAAPKGSLPLVELAAAADEVAFSLADTHPFSYAGLSHATNHDEATTVLAEVGRYYDPYVSPQPPGPYMSGFRFEGPPRGDWVLRVTLQFGGRGDAAYYWHVTVP